MTRSTGLGSRGSAERNPPVQPSDSQCARSEATVSVK